MLLSIRPFVLVLFSVLMLAGPCRPAGAAGSALDLLDTATAYSADFTLSGPKGIYHGKVWHAHGRERREVATSGGGQGVLLLRDADAAYLLSTGGHWYVGLSLRAAASLAGGLDAWTLTRTRRGEETVAGVRATRWTVRADGPKGGFSGDIWTSREGIVVKAVGTLENANGDDSPVEMTLSGLKVGVVDESKLSLPQGWFGMDLKKIPPEQIEKTIQSIKPLLESRGGG